MHDILDPLAAVCVGLVVEGPGDEALLLGLDLDHLLLHGVRGDEPVDGDGPGLAQPVDAVEALPLGRGVPGGVQQQQVVRRSQVQTHAASLQTEQDILLLQYYLFNSDKKIFSKTFQIFQIK